MCACTASDGSMCDKNDVKMEIDLVGLALREEMGFCGEQERPGVVSG